MNVFYYLLLDVRMIYTFIDHLYHFILYSINIFQYPFNSLISHITDKNKEELHS